MAPSFQFSGSPNPNTTQTTLSCNSLLAQLKECDAFCSQTMQHIKAMKEIVAKIEHSPRQHDKRAHWAVPPLWGRLCSINEAAKKRKGEIQRCIDQAQQPKQKSNASSGSRKTINPEIREWQKYAERNESTSLINVNEEEGNEGTGGAVGPAKNVKGQEGSLRMPSTALEESCMSTEHKSQTEIPIENLLIPLDGLGEPKLLLNPPGSVVRENVPQRKLQKPVDRNETGKLDESQSKAGPEYNNPVLQPFSPLGQTLIPTLIDLGEANTHADSNANYGHNFSLDLQDLIWETPPAETTLITLPTLQVTGPVRTYDFNPTHVATLTWLAHQDSLTTSNHSFSDSISATGTITYTSDNDENQTSGEITSSLANNRVITRHHDNGEELEFNFAGMGIEAQVRVAKGQKVLFDLKQLPVFD